MAAAYSAQSFGSALSAFSPAAGALRSMMSRTESKSVPRALYAPGGVVTVPRRL